MGLYGDDGAGVESQGLGGLAFAGNGPLERDLPSRKVTAVEYGVQSILECDGEHPRSNGAASPARGVSSLELPPPVRDVLPFGRNASLLSTDTRSRSLDAPIPIRPKSQLWQKEIHALSTPTKTTSQPHRKAVRYGYVYRYSDVFCISSGSAPLI